MANSMTKQQELLINNQKVMITSPDKLLWPKKGIHKIDYLHYLIQIEEHMLPFLKNRLLTVIRYPHGQGGEYFFQKNCPSYAPDFIETKENEGINYIVCSDLPTLVWLGNQLAFEFHIPFNTIHGDSPAEIVFDLDPPSRTFFHLAIEAALMIKEILDNLQLISYIKTSGNKGLQLYIPLPDNSFTYAQTRNLTQFIANYLVMKEPKWFTTERLKAKRGQRLYVDYLQHASGKTIIAPYSVRGNEEALVATPLFWEEVNQQLRPEHFPLDEILDRLKKKGCPFKDFMHSKKSQKLTPILEWLEANQ